jgi:hypothetical protein
VLTADIAVIRDGMRGMVAAARGRPVAPSGGPYGDRR